MSKILSFKNVHFSFDHRAIAALDNICFDLIKGETLVLLGPSGTGKSTLFSLIQKQRHALKGAVEINIDASEIAEFKAFSASELEQSLKTHLESKLTHLSSEAAHAEIHSMIDILGLQYKENRPLTQLSQGQLTRAMMARTLITKPKLVLLDEPLSHLDPALKRELVREFKDLAETYQFTSLWITHDPLEALNVASRLAYMAHGKLLQIGPPLDFVKAPLSLEIARFFAPINAFVAARVDGGPVVRTSFAEFKIEPALTAHLGDRFVIGLRASSFTVSSEGEFEGKYQLAGMLLDGVEVTVEGIDKNPIRLRLSAIPTSRRIKFSINWSEALFFAL